MYLLELIKGISSFVSSKKLDLMNLPSQGIFYNEDFFIKIKKAESEDILSYNMLYSSTNTLYVISLIKHIVNKNIFLPKGYSFNDIRSIDVVYIFFEIVKLTKGKKLFISDNNISYEVNEKNFNYFTPESKYIFDIVEKVYLDGTGYKYKIPSIGIEESVTKFLINKSETSNADYWNELSYDFMYFLGDKNTLTVQEIENMLTIFNHDIDSDEVDKIKEICDDFRGFSKYSLYVDDRILLVNETINLESIWE